MFLEWFLLTNEFLKILQVSASQRKYLDDGTLDLSVLQDQKCRLYSKIPVKQYMEHRVLSDRLLEGIDGMIFQANIYKYWF